MFKFNAHFFWKAYNRIGSTSLLTINLEGLLGSDLMAGALKIAPAKNEGRLKMDRMVIGPPCQKRESNSVNTQLSSLCSQNHFTSLANSMSYISLVCGSLLCFDDFFIRSIVVRVLLGRWIGDLVLTIEWPNMNIGIPVFSAATWSMCVNTSLT